MFIVLQTVFVVPEEGKSWVLKSVGESWRTFKHRVKENHYTKYKTDEERRQHRLDFITEDIFTDLLAYWSDDNVKVKYLHLGAILYLIFNVYRYPPILL